MRKNLFSVINSLLAVIVVLATLVWSGGRLLPEKALSAGNLSTLRIVYGTIDGAGNVVSGTGSGDFTSSFLGNNLGGWPIYNNNDAEYQINFNAATAFTSAPSVVATIATPTWRNGTAIVETPTTTGVKIRIGRVGEQLGSPPNGFSFIAIGQSSAPSSGINVMFGSINGGRGGGTPGAMVDPGSGGWSSYWSGAYNINFGPGVFTQTPTVVAGPDIGSPVDCLSFQSASVTGVIFQNYTFYCLSPSSAWGKINFIAVGAGANPLASLAVAQGNWTRSGGLNSGSTGILSVTSGAEWWSPNGYTVNFNSGFFAQNPIAITNASTPSYPPMFCSEAYQATSFGTTVHFTGGSDGGTDTCTYGDDRSDHSALGATMIAVGVSPIPPILASCNVDNANPPGSNPVVTFTANATGGLAPYTYQWLYPPGLASCGSGQTCSTNPLSSSVSAGTFLVNVIGSDTSQSGYVPCPQVNVTIPSKVSGSFSAISKQLNYAFSSLINTNNPINVYVRNIGPVSSTMSWYCVVDPAWPKPAGLTVDTLQCRGSGLRGGAPDFP